MPVRLPLAVAGLVAAPADDGPLLRALQATEAGEPDGDLLQVGEIAKASGKTVRAIHHYEEVGLLRPHARSKGRYRLYDKAALARVRWISKLSDLGLSLGQIQDIVRTFEAARSAPSAMSHIKHVYTQKLHETRAQIAHLEALQGELVASLAYLDTCDRCEPVEVVAACTACSHHDANEKAPHLVAGVVAGCSHVAKP